MGGPDVAFVLFQLLKYHYAFEPNIGRKYPTT